LTDLLIVVFGLQPNKGCKWSRRWRNPSRTRTLQNCYFAANLWYFWVWFATGTPASTAIWLLCGVSACADGRACTVGPSLMVEAIANNWRLARHRSQIPLPFPNTARWRSTSPPPPPAHTSKVADALAAAEGGCHTSQQPFPAIASIVITGSRQSMLDKRTFFSNHPTADLKTIRIPPLWCWEGIGMVWRLEMAWKAFVFMEGWEVREEAVGPGAVPLAWEDTFLSQLVELDQAQHRSEMVRSRATRWCYRSRLKTLSLIQRSNFMWVLVKKSCLVVGALYER
jgi:hypothetical protein